MKKIAGIFFLVFGITIFCAGQNILSKNISLEVSRQRLDNVLEILSNKADFYFSYNSKIVKKDSLISLSVHNKTIGEILNLLFNNTYEFKESGNYVIIRKAPIRLTMVTNKAVVEDKIYSVSGYVYDEQSGIAVNEASVYEKKQLVSSLTNERGYFKLKLKSSKINTATLFISKEFYQDTSIVIEPRHNQEIMITMIPLEREEEKVTISPGDYLTPDSLGQAANNTDTAALVNVTSPPVDSTSVERTGMGKFLLSTKQKIQSINLSNFFATRPFQVSLVPGLGSHGKMSGQVVNNFSLNVFGGYTAGTNGIEIGGLFNIDKKEVKYFQAAGIFNVVGGKVTGFQVGGVNNTVLNDTKGFQVAGVNNHVQGKFSGIQVGGVYNHVTDSVKGFQAAGVANFARRKVNGVQIGGVANVANREMSGVQIAGVFNYAKKLKGLQIGLINIADTSEGYSIGLINVVFKGYHKLSLSTNEVINFNASFKTGNSKLYSILYAGINAGDSSKVYSFGYGLGSELKLNQKKTLSINPEVTSQYLYLGSWDYTNIINRLQLNLNVKLGKYISLFTGPSYSVYISDQKTRVPGYRFTIPSSGYKTHSYSNNITGWLGWNAGICFF
jgi:hypothetical protein